MKIVKLDRRYAGYPTWNYALQFPIRGLKKLDLYTYAKTVSEIYGDERTHNPAYRSEAPWSHPYWSYNEHWSMDRSRGRILFKNQALITMLMLKVSS